MAPVAWLVLMNSTWGWNIWNFIQWINWNIVTVGWRVLMTLVSRENWCFTDSLLKYIPFSLSHNYHRSKHFSKCSSFQNFPDLFPNFRISPISLEPSFNRIFIIYLKRIINQKSITIRHLLRSIQLLSGARHRPYLVLFLPSPPTRRGSPRFSTLGTTRVPRLTRRETSWVTAFRRFIVAATLASTCYHALDYVTYGGAALTTGRINFFGNINHASKDRSLLPDLLQKGYIVWNN